MDTNTTQHAVKNPVRALRTVWALLALVGMVLWLALPQTVYAETAILFVDKDAPGSPHDGSSWNNAFLTLQDALTAADTSGGATYQIWVAEGVYTPGSSGDRSATFQGNSAYRDGAALYIANDSKPIIRNSIFWNNQDQIGTGTADATIYNYGAGDIPVISYSLVQGSGGSSGWTTRMGTDAGHNIDGDPNFVTPLDPAAAPTTIPWCCATTEPVWTAPCC